MALLPCRVDPDGGSPVQQLLGAAPPCPGRWTVRGKTFRDCPPLKQAVPAEWVKHLIQSWETNTQRLRGTQSKRVPRFLWVLTPGRKPLPPPTKILAFSCPHPHSRAPEDVGLDGGSPGPQVGGGGTLGD